MLKRLPLILAGAFFVVDALWVISLHLFAGTEIFTPLVQAWNYIHMPIRFFVEPKLFPVETADPLSMTKLDLWEYEGICILQSVLAGYVLGLLIQKLKKFI